MACHNNDSHESEGTNRDKLLSLSAIHQRPQLLSAVILGIPKIAHCLSTATVRFCADSKVAKNIIEYYYVKAISLQMGPITLYLVYKYVRLFKSLWHTRSHKRGQLIFSTLQQRAHLHHIQPAHAPVHTHTNILHSKECCRMYVHREVSSSFFSSRPKVSPVSAQQLLNSAPTSAHRRFCHLVVPFHFQLSQLFCLPSKIRFQHTDLFTSMLADKPPNNNAVSQFDNASCDQNSHMQS